MVKGTPEQQQSSSKQCLLLMLERVFKDKQSVSFETSWIWNLESFSQLPIHSKSRPKKKKGEWEPSLPYKTALGNIAMETAATHGCCSLLAHQLRLMKRLIPHLFNQYGKSKTHYPKLNAANSGDKELIWRTRVNTYTSL